MAWARLRSRKLSVLRPPIKPVPAEKLVHWLNVPSPAWVIWVPLSRIEVTVLSDAKRPLKLAVPGTNLPRSKAIE